MHLIKYASYSKAIDLGKEFLKYTKMEPMFESESEGSKNILADLAEKYKLNLTLVLSFGTGMELMVPIIKKLCENGEFKIDLNNETLVLMSLTAVTIAYLEEAKEEKLRKEADKHKDTQEELKEQEKLIHVLEKDSKSLLEELKLRGVGNGIIKKLILCIKAIGKLIKILFKHSKTIIDSFFDMFGYAAICIPILNSLKILINNYSWTLDNFYNNLESLFIGLGSLSARYLVDWFLDFRKNKQLPKELKDDNYLDAGYDSNNKEKLIKEQ
jgi:hypothetical protein